ncbi:MAG: hypothetical protein EAZ85_14435 [Bacteroidetes bacterium]|nr:MAG: hypothetical protein EAZ85_14435 [Bacteroidota bacterium]TAG86377.1 MAG: hypothetical protein EAZ20_12885 [Bacteroidota bacterium]
MKKISSIISIFWGTIIFLSLSSSGCASGGSGLSSNVAPNASQTGKAGSMARFAINGNYLYTLDNRQITSFDISNPSIAPVKKAVTTLGFGIETIFPYNNKLYIGTQTGMQVLSLNDPERPMIQYQFFHVRSCDPVVVQNDYVYVTLRGGVVCGGATNELNILKMEGAEGQPNFKSRFSMISPFGLGIDGNKLFICEGTSGLKFFDVSSPTNPMLISHITNIDAYDVIPLGNILLMIGKDGLYQYSYNQASNNIALLSKINIER